MTNVSSIIDPVTGLPLDQYSGIVQQIPLGQQVFPFADLDADGRMTRQPIYGDDVLPTTALLTGQDTTGAARAGTMDTARRLYTREAVFQNLGQPIPDGETAPIDVNVVSGGGGGGGGGITPISARDYQYEQDTAGSGFSQSLGNYTAFRVWGIHWTWNADLTSFAANARLWLTLSIAVDTGGNRWQLCSDYALNLTDPALSKCSGTQNIIFPSPLDIGVAVSAGSHAYFLRADMAGSGSEIVHHTVTLRWY